MQATKHVWRVLWHSHQAARPTWGYWEVTNRLHLHPNQSSSESHSSSSPGNTLTRLICDKATTNNWWWLATLGIVFVGKKFSSFLAGSLKEHFEGAVRTTGQTRFHCCCGHSIGCNLWYLILMLWALYYTIYLFNLNIMLSCGEPLHCTDANMR